MNLSETVEAFLRQTLLERSRENDNNVKKKKLIRVVESRYKIKNQL